MKNALAAFVLISFSFAVSSNLPAQQRGTQRTQVATAGAGRMDLNTALIDLDRVSQATQSDIANMHVEKWKSGWKPGFMKGNSHQAEAQQAATSLQRNLAYALPGLIHDVQNSRGSLSTTFKLYDDVSLVCEAVDSLINTSEAAGKKNEAAPLGDDYSALTRIRRSLSAYIQQASASWENHGKAPYAALSAPPAQQSQRVTSSSPQSAAARPANQSSSTQIVNDQGVKKIIVDDTIPEKKPAPKKKPETFSNL
ncbi:MAG TPA: hypothetical protein VHW72_13475 [Candidatus Angelobacter sp.]|jgi:hypothetical protein|nr:hypothetical protein [Candidatus Angelobacter sp.]